MCNLSGYVGHKPADINKLQLLLTLGRSRGKDSCGIVANNERELGYDKYTHPQVKTSDSIDFVQQYVFPEFTENNAVIMHNRASSAGMSRKLDAAHPFVYEYDNGVKLFFMHNGTIHNCYDIRQKFEIGINDHVSDTDLMGLILFEQGMKSFEEALMMYKGFANFVWFFSDEPNTLYVWKGGSYKEEKEKKIIYIERPLHYVIKDKCLYFSSLEEHLNTIFNGDCKVENFKCNHIIKLSANKRISSRKIDRDMPYYVAPAYNGYSGNTVYYGNANKNTYPKSFIYKPVDCKTIANGAIYWKEGAYYIGDVRVHGIIYYDTNDKLHRAKPTTVKEILYFFRGCWIKDSETYINLLTRFKINANVSALSRDYHPDSVHICHIGNLYFGDTFWHKGLDKTCTKRFMFKKYYINKKREFYKEESLMSVVKNFTNTSFLDLVDIDDKCLIQFNVKMATNFITRQEANNHYKEEYNCEVNILPDGCTDPDVMEYNMNYSTSLATRRQVNTHYYLNNGMLFNSYWEIDEEKISELYY